MTKQTKYDKTQTDCEKLKITTDHKLEQSTNYTFVHPSPHPVPEIDAPEEEEDQEGPEDSTVQGGGWAGQVQLAAAGLAAGSKQV